MTERSCATCVHRAASFDDATSACHDCVKSPEDRPLWEPVKVLPTVAPIPDQKANALDTQVGGTHYKDYPIQPIQYSMANKLDACQHSIVKYVTRFRDKGGIPDLEKARHFIDLLIGFERARTPEQAKEPNQ